MAEYTPADIVNLIFPVQGGRIPRMSGYALYGAMVSVVPAIKGTSWLQVDQLRGLRRSQGVTVVGPQASLLMRAPIPELPPLMPLVHQRLTVDRGWVQLGAPSVTPLQPAEMLGCPWLTVKIRHGNGQCVRDTWMTFDEFVGGVEQRLSQASVTARVHVDPTTRAELTIKTGTAVGYRMWLTGLKPEDSLQLQATGLGGRRKMGGGVLVPLI